MRVANAAVTFGSGATTKAMSASFNSDPIRVENLVNAAIQAKFEGGGAPTGTLKLQASSDVGTDPGTGMSNVTVSNWTDLTGTSQAISASGDHMWTLQNMGYRWVRIVYTRTSGDDTFSARLNGKGWG